MTRKKVLVLTLSTAILIGCGVCLYFARKPPKPLFVPWNAQSDLSLLEFKRIAPANTHLELPVRWDDKPSGTSLHLVAESGRDLYQIRSRKPLWVFWWDKRGEAQNTWSVGFLDAEARKKTWAQCNADGVYATISRDAYPVRVMILDPDQLG